MVCVVQFGPLSSDFGPIWTNFDDIWIDNCQLLMICSCLFTMLSRISTDSAKLVRTNFSPTWPKFTKSISRLVNFPRARLLFFYLLPNSTEVGSSLATFGPRRANVFADVGFDQIGPISTDFLTVMYRVGQFRLNSAEFDPSWAEFGGQNWPGADQLWVELRQIWPDFGQCWSPNLGSRNNLSTACGEAFGNFGAIS